MMTPKLSSDEIRDLFFFDNCNLPQDLKVKLDEVAKTSYAELYEPVTCKDVSLQKSLEEILHLFQTNAENIDHLRYVWMTLILAVVVRSTVKYYQPENKIPDKIILEIERWLLEKIQIITNPEGIVNYREKLQQNEVEFSIPSTLKKEIGSFQAWYEASDFFMNAIETLDRTRALEALLEILEDCLEGYAIFPGSSGRRDLFNWWLSDVVPASWCLRAPNSLYVVNNLRIDNFETTHELELHLLEKIQNLSSLIYSIVQDIPENSIKIQTNSMTV